LEAGAVPMGEQLWEQLRVEQGRPVPGQELTDDYNPLEAGLWHTISLSKGCYIGQETIARLHTYKGVKQQLWGVRLTEFAEPETLITVGEEKIGRLTSCTQSQDGYWGLAYIRSKNVAPELHVKVGESEGVLTELPFVSHEYI
jgi:folate-binding protein YgfZ